MSDSFSNIVQDKQEIKYQLSATHPAVSPVAKLFPESLEIVETVTKLTADTLDGTTLIWGSATQGDWGDDWGSDAVSSTALHAVLPRDNTYVEYFGQDSFIDTGNSTGVLDTAAETYTIDNTEILQSEVIAKFRSEINSAKIVTGLTNVNLFLSNDSGSTWNAVTENVLYLFSTTTTTDELKYRIVATDDVVISNPVTIYVN